MSAIVVALLDAVSWLLSKLGLPRAIRLGRALGSFAFHVLRIRRRVVLDNLARAFPEKSEAEHLYFE